MKFYVLTLFPQVIKDAVNFSILKRAQEKNLIEIIPVDIRSFAEGKHKVTDLPPYGGGAGMVLKPEPIFKAVEAIKEPSKIIVLSASGKLFNQKKAKDLSTEKSITLICGHYEGIDERVTQNLAHEEISVGDYVVSGGEYPALILIDAVARNIQGVLENKESLSKESFSEPLVEFPQYTRPEDFKGIKVPNTLLSGNHKEIEKWRADKSKEKTKENRPDLLHSSS